MNIIDQIEKQQMKTDIPDFKPGDRVKVLVKVVEGERERHQPFQGIVISRKGSGINEAFTVRRTSFGVGVERTFRIHSPRIASIEVVRRGRVRRAKLNFVRKQKGRTSKIKGIKDAR